MKSLLFITSVLFALVVVHCELGAAEPTDRLRVLSYNIHHGEGTDGKLDLERIAKVICSAEPDIVAIQEVDRGTVRSHQIDQPAVLARLTEMNVLFGKNIDYQGGGYGNAVLSKFPCKLLTNLKLPSLLSENGVDDREQRGALVVEVQPLGKESLLFVATHLDHRRPDKERLASAKMINDYIFKVHQDRPAILAGDLNATPSSDVLQLFGEAWHNATEGPFPTVPVSRPHRQIDYVLCRPANYWKIVEVQVLDEPVASDHRPVLAVLKSGTEVP